MPVLAGANANLSGLQVPNVYVLITQPAPEINGVPSNILGIVGVASWGPKNAPVTVSGPNDASLKLGPAVNRLHDLTSAVAFANANGAQNFRCVRVTDGTDAAASGTITADSAGDATAIAAAINNGQSGLRGPSNLVTASPSTATVTLTGKYTGSYGNGITATIGPGTKKNTTKVVVSAPGQVPETFDNIGTASSTAATVTLTGGIDGATTITGSVLLGTDTAPRTGVYALRATGAKVAYLADNSDSTTWSAEAALADAEGWLAVLAGASGEYTAIATAVTAKQTAGIDDYNASVLLGDWHYFNDPASGALRLTSPQHAYAGLRSTLSPEQSVLNKRMGGIVGTQSSQAAYVYPDADIAQLVQGGMEVIANPCPGGAYFGCRTGVNSSSNAAENNDNYSTLTNYIAYSMDAGIGGYIGQLQTPTVQAEAKATLEHFLQNMQDAGQIEAYSVVLGASNNPQSSVALGYMQALVRVTYFGVVRFFVVDLNGGPTVVVTPNA